MGAALAQTKVGVNNRTLAAAFICLISGLVTFGIRPDEDYGEYAAIAGAVLWLILIIAYICQKHAIINIGVDPGGGEWGAFNPLGSSPFWVPFKPQTSDVSQIIPRIRAQMERVRLGGGE